MRHLVTICIAFGFAACTEPFLHSVASPNPPEQGACADGLMNQDETDVDCGGVTCSTRCAIGQGCGSGGDCQSGACAGMVCVSPLCSNSVQDQDETDVDCGGSDCVTRCAVGEACLVDGDCGSDICDVDVCVSCSDGVENGDETNLDCGGPDCGGCDPGEVCSVDGDCLSNVCDPTDNICLGDCSTVNLPATGAAAALADLDLCAHIGTLNVVATDLTTFTVPRRLRTLGIVNIEGNASLVDLVDSSPAAPLTAMGGLTVAGNPSLTTISGFAGTTTMETLFLGDPGISAPNPLLADISGFAALQTLTGTDGLVIKECDSLEPADLAEFAALTATGQVRIHDNDGLTTFGQSGELPELESVGGFSIRDHVNLTSITSPAKLATFDPDGVGLEIHGNVFLETVSGFDLIERLTLLAIVNNVSLTSVTGFAGLKAAGRWTGDTAGGLTITGNTSLATLPSFDSLELIWWLRVQNSALIDLPGFNNLLSVDDELKITNNSVLADISGFANVVTAGIPPHGPEEQVDITDNPVLNATTGFPRLAFIGDRIDLQRNGSSFDPCSLAARLAHYDSLRPNVTCGGPTADRGDYCSELRGCVTGSCIPVGVIGSRAVGACSDECDADDFGVQGSCPSGETCQRNFMFMDNSPPGGGVCVDDFDCAGAGSNYRCVNFGGPSLECAKPVGICGQAVPLIDPTDLPTGVAPASTCRLNGYQQCGHLPGNTIDDPTAVCSDKFPRAGYCVAGCEDAGGAALSCGTGASCTTVPAEHAIFYVPESPENPCDTSCPAEYPHCVLLDGSTKCARVGLHCVPD